MQSGYGGVSEIPQFMVDSCATSLFSITSSGNVASAPASAAPPELKYHILPYHHHHHHLPQQPHPPQRAAPLLPHFSPFGQYSMPITQQLLQHPHHQFQLFQHHQPPPPPQLEHQSLIPQHAVALDQDSGPENSASPTPPIMGPGCGSAAAAPGVPPFLAAAMNFKLGINECSGAGSQEVINDDGGMLQGDDDGSESRLHLWQREDDSAIKEPPWRPLDIDYINKNNKRCNDKEPEASASKDCKKSKELAAKADDGGHATGGSNYKLFSELEAICQPGGSCGGTNQACSGSALTAGETPFMHYVTADVQGVLPAADQRVSGSETSAGEEATLKKSSKSGGARRRRKRRLQQQLSSVAAFFESLVKQLMDHQEGLHKKFLEVMEKRDQERTSRDEAWRKQEAAKTSGEAAARARERALAASREAAIVAFLEKITGESLNLPPDTQFRADDAHKKDGNGNDGADDLQTEPISADHVFSSALDDSGNRLTFNASRWPKAEVEALIQVRSGLESRFQEPGLKGPLWEEVSATMSAMGYSRSAKRCKEKWENINKYFRKAKENGKKRSQRSKTCPYFQQLDQLYSKSLANKPTPRPSSAAPSTDVVVAAPGNVVDSSELLDAIVVSTANEASGSRLAGNKAALELHDRNSEHDKMDGDVDGDGNDDDELGGGGQGDER